jgi:hypothetical protein
MRTSPSQEPDKAITRKDNAKTTTTRPPITTQRQITGRLITREPQAKQSIIRRSQEQSREEKTKPREEKRRQSQETREDQAKRRAEKEQRREDKTITRQSQGIEKTIRRQLTR